VSRAVYLTRSAVLAGLHTAPISTLKNWRRICENRMLELEHFVPEWPGLAESFAQDVRDIDARLSERAARER